MKQLVIVKSVFSTHWHDDSTRMSNQPNSFCPCTDLCRTQILDAPARAPCNTSIDHYSNRNNVPPNRPGNQRRAFPGCPVEPTAASARPPCSSASVYRHRREFIGEVDFASVVAHSTNRGVRRILVSALSAGPLHVAPHSS